MIQSDRHEILFCHDLLKFLEQKFPVAEFYDDFEGKSRSEFYFTHNNNLFLVEAKSDIESKSTPWKGEKFLDTRNAIRRKIPNKNDSKYARWIIFLAQLNDYAKRFNSTKLCNVMLGLPNDRLKDAKQGIGMIGVKKTKNITLSLNYNCEGCDELNVAYIAMKNNDLLKFISSI